MCSCALCVHVFVCVVCACVCVVCACMCVERVCVCMCDSVIVC